MAGEGSIGVAGTDRQAGGAARFAAWLLPLLRLLIAAILLSVLLRALLVEPFAVPTGSMAPTLEAGDFVFVNKSAYGWSRVSLPVGDVQPGDGERRLFSRPVLRGDVVVFVGSGGQDYVKRVIGVSGDRVEMRAGRLFVNGRALPCPAASGGLCREHNGDGRSYLVREDGSSSLSTFAEQRVPEGYLFVLGDNRDSSTDSRVPQADGGLGMVAEWQVIGRASRIFLSLDDGMRWERIGRRID